jgi:outer membrane protein OmpA-like peptidoglycan-associated protein
MKVYACALLAALGASSPALAGDPESPLSHGFYVAPMATYVDPHNERQLDAGFGGSLAAGYRVDEALAIELSGTYSELDSQLNSGESAEMVGGSLGVLAFLSDAVPGVFLGFSAGYLETDHQGLTGDRYSGWTFDAGLGYLLPLSFGNYDFGIRAEARFRHNNGQKGQGDGDANNRGLAEGVYSLGLQLPLGMREPAPPPVATPVAVVPVVSACGDGVDNDGDGRIDYPADPGCTSVDDDDETDPAQCKDGVDNDGDGLTDYPADKGCSSADDDDETDPCKTPEQGERVSLQGCGTGDVIVLRGVNFEFDRAHLTTNAKTILDNVANELVAYPSIEVEIGGHTDSKGGDQYNQKLSEERAQSVLDYLSSKGVARDRLRAVGYGESDPVDDNETDEGREANRRVELKVTAGTASAAPVSEAAPGEDATESEPMVEDSEPLEAEDSPTEEPPAEQQPPQTDDSLDFLQ